jgi:hypothetical protein
MVAPRIQFGPLPFQPDQARQYHSGQAHYSVCIYCIAFDIFTGDQKYSNVEVPLTRQVVSAHLTLPSKHVEVQHDTIHLIAAPPVLVAAEAGPVGTDPHNRLLGILGLIVVGTILGLAIYSAVIYLS